MDRLHSILEEAQTVINQDGMAFRLKDRPLNFPSMICPLPSPSDIKPFVHKANKSSAKKRTWKKPIDKPKRPLSAYNLFFQHERKKIIAVLPGDMSVNNDGLTEEQRRRKHRKTHGKIGFGDLARNIAQNWKTIDNSARSIFEARADTEKARYRKELDAWKKTNVESGEREKAGKKKKTPTVSVSKSRLEPSTQSSENPKEAAFQPDAMTSMLASNYRQAQLIQSMMNSQALAHFQQQNMNDANVYEVLMASCSEPLQHRQRGNFEQPRRLSEPLLHRQRGNFDQPRRLSQPNNFCVNSVPQTNQLTMLDLTSSCYTPSAVHQRCTLPSETFLKESFFDDVVDTTSPEVFSDTEFESALLEENLDEFIDDFDSEMLLRLLPLV